MCSTTLCLLLTGIPRFGQQPPYEVRSIIYPSALDTILTFFARRPLTGTEVSPRSSDIPKLSDAQIEALDTIQSIAEGVSLTLRLSKGDILFWNNRGLLHCRKGFTDTPGHKRHLLRVWLQNEAPEARVVPDELRHLWDAAFLPTGGKRQWPVEPITDREYVTNQQRSSGHA